MIVHPLVNITALAALISSSEAATLKDLEGMSVDAQSTMRYTGLREGVTFNELNTRSMRVYISTQGRLFDYSKVDSVGAFSGRVGGSNQGSTVVRVGQRWVLGNVGQMWTLSGDGLVRTRIYPWGRQVYNIKIAKDLQSCTIEASLKSSQPDNAFFLFGWGSSTKLTKIVSSEPDSGSCKIVKGNIFDNGDQQ
jgi:hypothetical protein